MRLVDCRKRRIVPLGDCNVAVANHSHVLGHAVFEFFELGDGADGRHVVGSNDDRRRHRELHQVGRSISPVNDVPFARSKQLGSRLANRLSLAVATDCEAYLKDRLCRLEQQLETVGRIAQSGELPDVIITVSGSKITPLARAVPEEADQLIRQAYALLPRVKITELLLEVES